MSKPSLCRYEDCVENNKVAAEDEQITCSTCRDWLGLPSLEHREIDCPVCPGPVCVKDGNGPEMVWTLTYIHKHGHDVGAYRSHEGAVNAAHALAFERSEEWDDKEATARFKAEEDKLEALDIFDEVEMEWAYSEILEITATELQD